MSTKIKVGLALGGGVVRGMAHIGVLSVLEEAGIPVDYIAGTSAGSLVGGIYCAGYSTAQIKEHAMRLRWWHLLHPVLPRQGFFSFAPMERWLARILGDLTFDQLKIPFTAVATDLERAAPVWLRQGRLAPAIRASCSVPGIFTPVRLNGLVLGDGSLADTVPVDVLRQMGAEYVIGVDIFIASIRRGWGALGMGVNALEILVERAGGGIDRADCLIAPALRGESYVRFSQRERIYRLGEQAAREKLPSILSDLERLERGEALEMDRLQL